MASGSTIRDLGKDPPKEKEEEEEKKELPRFQRPRQYYSVLVTSVRRRKFKIYLDNDKHRTGYYPDKKI